MYVTSETFARRKVSVQGDFVLDCTIFTMSVTFSEHDTNVLSKPVATFDGFCDISRTKSVTESTICCVLVCNSCAATLSDNKPQLVLTSNAKAPKALHNFRKKEICFDGV